jgi:hypothetical protein
VVRVHAPPPIKSVQRVGIRSRSFLAVSPGLPFVAELFFLAHQEADRANPQTRRSALGNQVIVDVHRHLNRAGYHPTAVQPTPRGEVGSNRSEKERIVFRADHSRAQRVRATAISSWLRSVSPSPRSAPSPRVPSAGASSRRKSGRTSPLSNSLRCTSAAHDGLLSLNELSDAGFTISSSMSIAIADLTARRSQFLNVALQSLFKPLCLATQ